mmetsp:Transcript_83173/g.101923  ORF Transcript_83173/g.101923 Transcript_83173/m.101923 type:complete len:536 (-) Transcript_83173:33-1640(-)
MPKDKEQTFDRDNDKLRIDREGLIKFILPPNVFYNPAMSTNRDVSILAIETYGIIMKNKLKNKFNKLKIFEGLSATGLRSCRYINEINPELISYVQANDLDYNATQIINKNRELNGISIDKLCVSNADCNNILSNYCDNKYSFDVIDIDPYGSCAPFVDSAIRAIKNGGMLCVTSTDLSLLCGNNKEACWRKYGSVPIHETGLSHEFGLRIILNLLSRVAGKYGKGIKPLVSMYIDYYMRIFVEITDNKIEANDSIVKCGYLLYCHTCGNFNTNKYAFKKDGKYYANTAVPHICEYCGKKFKLYGPVWIDKLHNKEFVNEMLSNIKTFEWFPTYSRLECRLKLIEQELSTAPFFYITNIICKKLKLDQIPLKKLRSALSNMGFDHSLTHCNSDATKTSATYGAIIDIYKKWYSKSSKNNYKMNELGKKIFRMRGDTYSDISFNLNKNVMQLIKMKLFKNPPLKWGPKPMAKKNDDNYNINMFNINNIKIEGDNVKMNSDIDDDIEMIIIDKTDDLNDRAYVTYKKKVNNNLKTKK